MKMRKGEQENFGVEEQHRAKDPQRYLAVDLSTGKSSDSRKFCTRIKGGVAGPSRETGSYTTARNRTQGRPAAAARKRGRLDNELSDGRYALPRISRVISCWMMTHGELTVMAKTALASRLCWRPRAEEKTFVGSTKSRADMCPKLLFVWY